jgi:hypothetical protein
MNREPPDYTILFWLRTYSGMEGAEQSRGRRRPERSDRNTKRRKINNRSEVWNEGEADDEERDFWFYLTTR